MDVIKSRLGEVEEGKDREENFFHLFDGFEGRM